MRQFDEFFFSLSFFRSQLVFSLVSTLTPTMGSSAHEITASYYNLKSCLLLCYLYDAQSGQKLSENAKIYNQFPEIFELIFK